MAKKFSIDRLEERLAPSSWHVGPVVQDGGQHYDADNPSGGKGHSSHGAGHGYGHRHADPCGGCVPKDGPCDCDPVKVKGNNGFGNGGDDPAPGNSGTNGAPNANQKLADVVR